MRVAHGGQQRGAGQFVGLEYEEGSEEVTLAATQV